MTFTKKRQRIRGSILLALLFTQLVAILGLALIGFSLSHHRILRARQNKVNDSGKIRQVLIEQIHLYIDTVSTMDLQNMVEPISDYFNSQSFPDSQESEWSITNSFNSITTEKGNFRKYRITNTMSARGKIRPYFHRAGIILEILSGKIPLACIPFFIHLDHPGTVRYLKDNNIKITPQPSPSFTGPEVDFNITGFLLDVLKIAGEVLSWQTIREKLGLEIKMEPIRDGIYTVIEGDRIEAVFIQGDVQQLIFSVEEKMQVIQILIQETLYELKYVPGDYLVSCWDMGIDPDSRFYENIVVNGNVWSVCQKGAWGFCEDANIMLYVSGSTIITSVLRSRCPELNKIKTTNFTLVSSSSSLCSNPNSQSSVVIRDIGKTSLDATLIVNGQISNYSNDLILNGSLYARKLKNDGSLTIHPLKSRNDLGRFFNIPDYRIIDAFFVNYIEEVYDEK